MKNKFKEYFTPSEIETKSLWDDCIFIFDTNVLLNFYRYSDETVNALKEAISYYKLRVWIPYNVGYEFFERRIGVIEEQINNYQEKSKTLKGLIKSFTEKKGHPFISNDLLIQLRTLSDKVDKECSENSKSLRLLINKQDIILDTILELFDSLIGDQYSDGELKQIHEEGEYRYANLIPPGFMDIRKEERRRYGDYIIWKQIIDKSNESGKSIIFITDDEKEDWSLKRNNVVLGPLPELIKEFSNLTTKQFYSYNTLEFIKRTSIDTNNVVNKEVLDEIEYVSSNKNEAIDNVFNGGYYRNDFIIKMNTEDGNSIQSFTSILSSKGYHLMLQEQNGKVFYFSVLVKYEDLIRRLYNLLNEICDSLSIKLISFKSNTIDYSYSNEP